MLNPNEQRQLKKYEADIAMSRWKFILIYGVISWGVTVAILVTLFDLIIDGKPLQQQWRENMWTRFLILPFMGIFIGLFKRWMITKQITRLRRKEEQTNKGTFPSNQG